MSLLLDLVEQFLCPGFGKPRALFMAGGGSLGGRSAGSRVYVSQPPAREAEP